MPTITISWPDELQLASLFEFQDHSFKATVCGEAGRLYGGGFSSDAQAAVAAAILDYRTKPQPGAYRPPVHPVAQSRLAAAGIKLDLSSLKLKK